MSFLLGLLVGMLIGAVVAARAVARSFDGDRGEGTRMSRVYVVVGAEHHIKGVYSSLALAAAAGIKADSKCVVAWSGPEPAGDGWLVVGRFERHTAFNVDVDGGRVEGA